jgi:hypothetical protein
MGRQLKRIAGITKFSRMDLAVIPFIFAGLGAAFVSAMAGVAFGYDSRPQDIALIVHYAGMLLFFPAFLVALLHRRWASLPLLVCFIALITPTLAHPRELIEVSSRNGALPLVVVVFFTETARLIRGNAPKNSLEMARISDRV